MSIIIKPIITEKATLGSELHNRYTFLVHPKSNKVEIKKAVEAAYGVYGRKGAYHELWTPNAKCVIPKQEYRKVKPTLLRKQLYT
jgi:hypothetical protein